MELEKQKMLERQKLAEAQRLAEEAKFANEELNEPDILLKEFLAKDAKNRDTNELFRKLNK